MDLLLKENIDEIMSKESCTYYLRHIQFCWTIQDVESIKQLLHIFSSGSLHFEGDLQLAIDYFTVFLFYHFHFRLSFHLRIRSSLVLLLLFLTVFSRHYCIRYSHCHLHRYHLFLKQQKSLISMTHLVGKLSWIK